MAVIHLEVVDNVGLAWLLLQFLFSVPLRMYFLQKWKNQPDSKCVECSLITCFTVLGLLSCISHSAFIDL